MAGGDVAWRRRSILQHPGRRSTTTSTGESAHSLVAGKDGPSLAVLRVAASSEAVMGERSNGRGAITERANSHIFGGWDGLLVSLLATNGGPTGVWWSHLALGFFPFSQIIETGKKPTVSH